MDIKQALQTVVEFLDEKMSDEPSRELADVSNYLQALLDEGDL